MCTNCKSVKLYFLGLSVTTSCKSREFFPDQIYFLWSNSACFYTEMEKKVSIYSWIFFYHLLLVITDCFATKKKLNFMLKFELWPRQILVWSLTFLWQRKVKLYGIIVTAMIFDCVILLGYYCLVFTDRWKENCKIKPELVTYLTSLGTVAIFSVLTVIIVLLSSAHPTKQECCSGKANFTLETNI